MPVRIHLFYRYVDKNCVFRFLWWLHSSVLRWHPCEPNNNVLKQQQWQQQQQCLSDFVKNYFEYFLSPIHYCVWNLIMCYKTFVIIIISSVIIKLYSLGCNVWAIIFLRLMWKIIKFCFFPGWHSYNSYEKWLWQCPRKYFQNRITLWVG